MPVSYEYSLGSVRAKEKQLFSKADIEAMLNLSSVSAIIAFLKDKNYATGDSIDEMFKNSTLDTLGYLCGIVPDGSIFDCLIYPNDAHNIKAVIKGMLSDVDYKRLFVNPSLIELESIEKAVKENKYDLLPEYISPEAKKAYEILAHTADARLADAYIDRACMEYQLKKAKETKIPFLFDYISADIFYKNVKIALRGALTNANKDYFEEALCEVDGFDKKTVINFALKGEGDLVEYLLTRDAYKCNLALEEYKKSPAAFERFTDNFLMGLAIENCRKSGTGAEAAVGYYIARLAQDKAVHIIAVGIDTDTDKELIRERLREIYG